MSFCLSKKSLGHLTGVHPDLYLVVRRAIDVTPVDFTVLEGLRSVSRQKEMMEQGKSRTMRSRHLTGHAVDVGAWVEGQIDWSWDFYPKIASAFREISIATHIPVVWGAVWDRTLSELSDDLEAEITAYKKRQRARGIKKPLIDGDHFELPRSVYP